MHTLKKDVFVPLFVGAAMLRLAASLVLKRIFGLPDDAVFAVDNVIWIAYCAIVLTFLEMPEGWLGTLGRMFHVVIIVCNVWSLATSL